MSKVEIICLANSRKMQGRCIAGIRTDGKGWIRPVGNNEYGGALFPENYTLNNGSEPPKLSVIEIGVCEAKPKEYQPENWLIDSSQWLFKTKHLTSFHLLLMKKAFFTSNDLFGTTSARIPLSQFEQLPAKSSLEIIQPQVKEWRITNSYRGNRQIRVIFQLQNVEYNLVVTDPDWTEKLEKFELGSYDSQAIGIPHAAKFLFTISLGEPFQGDCYKLVAAVIPYYPHPI